MEMDLTKSLFSKSPRLSFRQTDRQKELRSPVIFARTQGFESGVRVGGNVLEVRTVVQIVAVSARTQWGERVGYHPLRVPHRWCAAANPIKKLITLTKCVQHLYADNSNDEQNWRR